MALSVEPMCLQKAILPLMAALLWAQLGFALFKILEQRQGGYRYGCDLHFFGNCQDRFFSVRSLYPIVDFHSQPELFLQCE